MGSGKMTDQSQKIWLTKVRKFSDANRDSRDGRVQPTGGIAETAGKTGKSGG